MMAEITDLTAEKITIDNPKRDNKEHPHPFYMSTPLITPSNKLCINFR